jgi:hypothetical protein
MTSVECNCVKTPTLNTIIFELAVIAGTILAFFLLSKFKKNFLKHYFVVMIGVAIFEIFTAPMWHNSHLGNWAYIYKDVSWVLNIGWSSLILSVVIFTDSFFKKISAWKRFFVYLVILTPVIFLLETLVTNIGIRTYSPEVLHALSGISLIGTPIEGFYYFPVFIALVIGFYKYWSFMLDKVPVVPLKNVPLFKKLILTFIGVFLFELMIEPMVTNAKLPSWSYIYRDISFIMSGLWILIIWASTSIVDHFFIHFNLTRRFILYLAISALIATPLEALLIDNGYRIYGPTATSNFSGVKSIIFNVPIEVIFAIPMYLALIIGFIRYWEIITKNIHEKN